MGLENINNFKFNFFSFSRTMYLGKKKYVWFRLHPEKNIGHVGRILFFLFENFFLGIFRPAWKLNKTKLI